MTIPIENTDIRAEQLVGSYSRYKNSNVIYYDKDSSNYITFETYIRKDYVSTGQESIMVIPAGAEYRPDLISYDVYGVPDVWWRILEANGMKDIWEFKTGTTIILPSMF